MLEFCVWEGKGTNPAGIIKPCRKNIEQTPAYPVKHWLAEA